MDVETIINIIPTNTTPSIPYSVISAKTLSGVASFVTKVSNTEINFDTDSGLTPIKICYPDKSIESNSSLTGITGISVGGTYHIIKEKGYNPYITPILPVENYVAPSTPATNQLWLDISVVPHVPKKWNGSSWVITQYVKLGQVIKSGGVIGTPVSYALNGTFTSQLLPLPGANINTTFAHNIGSESSVEFYAKCITPLSGFTVGKSYKLSIVYIVSGIAYYENTQSVDMYTATFSTKNQGCTYTIPSDLIGGASNGTNTSQFNLYCVCKRNLIFY